MNNPNNYWCGARLVIPETFEDCLSYGQRQYWLYQQIVALDARVTALEEALNINQNTQNSQEPGL